jgi:hypothetical protein
MNATILKMQEELRSVSASLKSLAVSQITQPPAVHVVNSSPKPAASTPKPAPTATPQKAAPATSTPEGNKMRSLDDIRMSFPEELESRLSFEEKGEYIIIKPKQFLITSPKSPPQSAAWAANISAPVKTATSESQRKKPKAPFSGAYPTLLPLLVHEAETSLPPFQPL